VIDHLTFLKMWIFTIKFSRRFRKNSLSCFLSRNYFIKFLKSINTSKILHDTLSGCCLNDHLPRSCKFLLLDKTNQDILQELIHESFTIIINKRINIKINE